MSWFGSVTVPKGTTSDDLGKRGGLLDQMTVSGNTDCPHERDEAVGAAKGAVVILLRSGVLGDLEAHAWAVQINGHCNPGNAKQDGSAEDCIGVNIRQVP